MRVAILSDANSGISEDEAKQLGVYIIPMPVVINDKTYFEGKNFSYDTLYKALDVGMNVTTSQPVPADLLAMWDNLLETYDEVLYIPMTSTLSGSYFVAKGFSDDYHGKVKVVDNHRISVTLRCAVIKAKKMADEGSGADEIKKYLEETALCSTIYFAVNSLDFLKRGGRIASAAATIGNLLKIKSILTFQGGRVEPFMKVRGSMQKCKEKMIEAVLNDWKNRFSSVTPHKVQIGAAGAGLSELERNEWVSQIKAAFPNSDVFYRPISASIAAHTGPGTVGLGASFEL